MNYTFLHISPSGSIPTFDVLFCPDAQAACTEASRVLMRNPERRAIEVWDDTSRLYVVESGAPPLDRSNRR